MNIKSSGPHQELHEKVFIKNKIQEKKYADAAAGNRRTFKQLGYGTSLPWCGQQPPHNKEEAGHDKWHTHAVTQLSRWEEEINTKMPSRKQQEPIGPGRTLVPGASTPLTSLLLGTLLFASPCPCRTSYVAANGGVSTRSSTGNTSTGIESSAGFASGSGNAN